MPQMNPSIKNKWLTALRSGKYTHGRSKLKSINGQTHCCLGVLCEIAVEEKLGEWVAYGPSEMRFYSMGESKAGVVPRPLADLLGVTEHQGDLTELNDYLSTIDYTAQIAYIEENL